MHPCNFRGFTPRQLRAQLLCTPAVGAVALGAVVVHATCGAEGGLHMLLGHSLAPVWAALLLATPAGSVIRLLQRRSDRPPET